MLGWLVYQNVSMCLNHHVPIVNRTATRQERSRSTLYRPKQIPKGVESHISDPSASHTHARTLGRVWFQSYQVLIPKSLACDVCIWSGDPALYQPLGTFLNCIFTHVFILYTLQTLREKRQLYNQGRGEIRSALT